MIHIKKCGQMPSCVKSVEAAKQEFNTEIQHWERMDVTHHLHGDTLHLIARDEHGLAAVANRHYNRGYR
jgi:hypothetical protein